MPRASEPVDDTTSLNASRIDVCARIGWLLRVSRTVAGLSLRQMSAELAARGTTLSAATLSRIESEGQRSVAALEGYADVLGLPEASLRVPVDVMCRSFSYGPPTALPAPAPDLDDFTRICRAVDEPTPDAGAWSVFARHHVGASGYGLPEHLMAPYVRHLALDLCRSVGVPRWTRYEALRMLRCSAYGELVAAVVRDELRDPDLNVPEDLVNIDAEQPAAEVVAWASSLLQDPSILLARSATYALQGMLVAGGLQLEHWRCLPAALERAWRAAEGDLTRRKLLSHLWSALPTALRDEAPGVCPPPAAGPRSWTRNRQNRHYEFASALARSVTSGRGLPDDAMLARLLFEAMFDPRGVRMAVATCVLAASPFDEDLVRVLLARRSDGPEGASRAATQVAALCHVRGELVGVDSLLVCADPAEFRNALNLVGRGGHRLPDAALERGLAGDELTWRSTIVALGRAGDPRLADLTVDLTRSTAVRGGARWWLEHGPRIVD